MGLPAFDTHAYVKRLKLAGFTDKQAEAQSELQAEVLSTLVTEKLATKEDIARLAAEIKQNSGELRQELKQEISELRQDIVNIKVDLIKWVFGIAFAQTALIFSVLKFMH